MNQISYKIIPNGLFYSPSLSVQLGEIELNKRLGLQERLHSQENGFEQDFHIEYNNFSRQDLESALDSISSTQREHRPIMIHTGPEGQRQMQQALMDYVQREYPVTPTESYSMDTLDFSIPDSPEIQRGDRPNLVLQDEVGRNNPFPIAELEERTYQLLLEQLDNLSREDV